MEHEDEVHSDGSFELVNMDDYDTASEKAKKEAVARKADSDGSYEYLCSEVSETLVLTEDAKSESAKEETGSKSPKEEDDDDMGLINDKESVLTDEVKLGLISDIIPTNVELDVGLICDTGFNLAEKEVADGSMSDSDSEAKETDYERFELAGSSDVRKGKRRCLGAMIDQVDFDVEKFPENFEMKNDIRDVAKNQILRFLPAKALARSRLVSRKWNEWIKNPFFWHMQCQSHKDTSGFFQDNNTIIRFISLNHDASGVPHPDLSFIPRRVFIKASCNGLLLCQTSTDDSEFLVCNPANKQYFWLPPSSYYHGATPKIVLAFEPSSLNFEPSYQVICPFSLPDPSQGPIVYFDIFDSRTRSWRVSETICVDLHESDVRSNGIYVGGVAYWETTGGELLGFDLKNEIYGVQSVPYVEGGALSKVNGELCYVKANYHHETSYCFLDVFSGGAMTLKDSLGFEVDCFEDGMDVNCVVVGNPCDDMIAVVLQSRRANHLYAYSLKEKMAIGPCIIWGSVVKLFPYVNSLIPIDTA